MPGHFRTLTADKWSGISAPPRFLPTNGPIFEPKKAFDSLQALTLRISCKILSEGHWWRHKSGQRSNFWLSVIAGLAGQCSRIILKRSRWDGMDHFCDSFKYTPRPLVRSYWGKVIQGHNVKRPSLKFWVLILWYPFIGEFSSRTQKWY